MLDLARDLCQTVFFLSQLPSLAYAELIVVVVQVAQRTAREAWGLSAVVLLVS